MIQQSRQRSSTGYKVALSGGILATLAFLVFPYISIGIFGSYTAVQLANGVFGVALPILWLELLDALIVVGLASFSWYKKSNTITPAGIIAGLSGIALSVLAFTYIQQSTQSDIIGGSAASYYSTGFWLYLVGMITALVGGILQLRTEGQQVPRQQPLPFQQPQQPRRPNWSEQPPSQSPPASPQP